MINMFKFEKKKGMDISWLRKRYVGLLVDFPKDLTPEILKNDDICSKYDPEEAYDALKLAHEFLTGISQELLADTEETDERVNNKLRLLWYLLERGAEFKEESSNYCFYFNKHDLYVTDPNTGKKVSWGSIPKNYPKDFKLISENGCYVEYYKNGNITEDFTKCDSGALYFGERLTALGLKLFYDKVIKKRWYQKYDIGNRYSTYTGLRPKACKEVFDRVDMRIFNCGERLEFNIKELLAGYNDELAKCFMKIYNFVKQNYPDCLPYINIAPNLSCFSATFGVDEKHRMIGQINFGTNENHFDAYIAMSGKEWKAMLADVDSFSEKVVGLFLHDISCDCAECQKKKGKLDYRGKAYSLAWNGTENRFLIENEDDADQVIKCIKIKAECNMKTRTKEIKNDRFQ